MAAALMWLIICTAACLIGVICMIPGWIVRKVRDRMELNQIRRLYPKYAGRRRYV